MRLLADENVPVPTVDWLIAAGHDVDSVVRDGRGSTDKAVLQRAAHDQRVLLTFDRDFGDLVYREGESGRPGVVFFRLTPRSPIEPAEVLLEALATPGIRLDGYFTVLERNHVRQRPLPSSR